MSQSTDPCTCLNCGKSETETPLLRLRYSGVKSWLCSQCMPVLIHNPEEVGAKLAAIVTPPAE